MRGARIDYPGGASEEFREDLPGLGREELARNLLRRRVLIPARKPLDRSSL